MTRAAARPWAVLIPTSLILVAVPVLLFLQREGGTAAQSGGGAPIFAYEVLAWCQDACADLQDVSNDTDTMGFADNYSVYAFLEDGRLHWFVQLVSLEECPDLLIPDGIVGWYVGNPADGPIEPRDVADVAGGGAAVRVCEAEFARG